MEDNTPETPGTKMARELRTRCNSLTPDERAAALEAALTQIDKPVKYAPSKQVLASARSAAKHFARMFRRLAE